jgi:D-alanine-D-alanine ligase
MYIGVVYCTPRAEWVRREIGKEADCEIEETAEAVRQALEHGGHRVQMVDLKDVAVHELRQFDWVFNLAETIDGFPLKEYEVAAQMEVLNIPFTGSRSRALYNCSDKASAKNRLSEVGLPTPGYEVFRTGFPVITRLQFPLIVKPVQEDGSIGIFSRSVVRSQLALEERVAEVHECYQQPAIVEEYIEGRDIGVSVLGNGPTRRALPPSECVYLNDFEGERILTYEAKWLVGSNAYENTKSVCPTQLEEPVREAVKNLALRACDLMDCRDYARVDLRLRGDESFLIEVNTNPCINPVDTAYTRASRAAGYTYDQLVNEILNESIKNQLPVSKSGNMGWINAYSDHNQEPRTE